MSGVIRASSLSLVAVAVALAGATCGAPKPEKKVAIEAMVPQIYPALADTIGQYAMFIDGESQHVEGYGVVAQLPGTGSGDMPPSVQSLLIDQLHKAGADSYMNNTQRIKPADILKSNLIAAVEVHGAIPPLARKGDSFDLKVNCLPSSQATSLSGGLLWTSELKVVGLTADTNNDTRRIALGRGPVLVSMPIDVAMGNEVPTQPAAARRALRTARVLNGGRVEEDRLVRLQLHQASMMRTGVIERAINSRFPGREKAASAENDSIVSLKVPLEYQDRPMEFINLVMHMFLSQESPGFTERKAAELIRALADPDAPHQDISIALQALGRSILPGYIQAQYTNPNPSVRFWCARAGAGLRDVGGMVVLQEFAKNEQSPFKQEAVSSVVEHSRSGDIIRATITLREMLNSKDLAERIAAYEGLVAIRADLAPIDPPILSCHSIGSGKFLLDIVPCDAPPAIYVTQQGLPRIALIGRPITLPQGALYISPDNALTVVVQDAPPPTVITASVDGADADAPSPPPENVVHYYRSPFGDRTVEVRSSTRIQDVIARLGWAPQPKAPGYDPKALYIGASYQSIAEMLATLCHRQILGAQFVLQNASEDPYRTTSDLISESRPEGSTAPIAPAVPAVPGE
ncbi:MAG: flagellar basal body P-ring protein FlgI [Phycisphaerales bacterium]|nr:flagellar basal body P-ring protein FlgI [Phycisphaerales bacterium]